MGKVAPDLERLAEEIGELREERANFLKELGADEATRREEAEEARAERQSFVSSLKGDVGEMLDGFRAAHEEMGEQTRRQLSEVRSDLEAGRRAFFGPGPTEVRAEHARRRAEREREAKEKAARERRTAEEAKRHPDDLTVISGIGPKSQERLNRAGIYTYKQLAQSSPEGLREALGELPPGAAVDDWVAGARELL